MTAVAHFSGTRSATAPLTWGQQAIWKIIAALAPNDAFLNVRRIVPVPARATGTVESVTAAIGALITRHEALRTRICVIDGEPRQVVDRDGHIALDLLHAADTAATAATADEAVRRLREVPFDHAGELPIRVTLVVAAGRVSHIVLILTHVAADWQGADILDRDLRVLLLRGTITTPPGLQPADLAGRQRGDAGQRQTDRALRHWRAQYDRLPVSVFPEVAAAASPRYRMAVFTSRALHSASREIAARCRTSSSTVLLAATCALIGAWTGHTTCGMLTIVNNRFQDGHRDMVTSINQLGVLALDLHRAETFDDLVAEAWREALQCFRHAYYDQAAIDRMLAAGGHLHGEKIEPFCCFNDMRASDVDLRGGTGFAADSVRRSAADSELVWTETFDEFNWRFTVVVNDAPGAVSLSLATDSCYLPPGDTHRFLLDLEDLVIRAACGQVRLAELAGRAS